MQPNEYIFFLWWRWAVAGLLLRAKPIFVGNFFSLHFCVWVGLNYNNMPISTARFYYSVCSSCNFWCWWAESSTLNLCISIVLFSDQIEIVRSIEENHSLFSWIGLAFVKHLWTPLGCQNNFWSYLLVFPGILLFCCSPVTCYQSLDFIACLELATEDWILEISGSGNRLKMVMDSLEQFDNRKTLFFKFN